MLMVKSPYAAFGLGGHLHSVLAAISKAALWEAYHFSLSPKGVDLGCLPFLKSTSFGHCLSAGEAVYLDGSKAVYIKI